MCHIHESLPITTLLFGDKLPLSIRTIKRISTKSSSHDRRKTTALRRLFMLTARNLVSKRAITVGLEIMAGVTGSNLNFVCHYKYRKPPSQRSQSPFDKLRRAPVQRPNSSAFASPKRLSSGRWPFGKVSISL